MKKNFFVLLLIFAFYQAVYPEVAQVKRLEIEKEFGSNIYFFACGKAGVVSFSIDKVKTEEGDEQLSFVKYDSGLEKVWEKSIVSEKNVKFRDYDYDDKFIYIHKRNMFKKTFQMIIINLTTGEEKIVAGEAFKKGSYEKFYAFKDYLYFFGTISNQYNLICHNINTNQQTVIPFGTKKKTIFKNFNLHEDKGLTSLTYYDSELKIYYLSIIKNNAVVNTLEFPQTDTEHVFNSGTLNFLNEKQMILVGTYNKEKDKDIQGVYTATIEDNKISNVKYTGFSSFKNFFNFMSERQKERMEKKIEKKAQKGKEMEFNYNFLEHNLIFTDYGYIWIGESYYATYRTEFYTTTVNGQTVTRSRTVFDGYVYSHATVAGFSNNGDLLWDQCFKLGDFKTFTLYEFVKAIPGVRRLLLVYSVGKKIRSMEIEGNNVVQEKENIDIETLDIDKNIIYSYSRIAYWYDNYFLCMGSQKVKDEKADFGKKRKTVYFLNKVNYQ